MRISVLFFFGRHHRFRLITLVAPLTCVVLTYQAQILVFRLSSVTLPGMFCFLDILTH